MDKDHRPVGLYCSHDANLAVKIGPSSYRVAELERIFRQRNFSLVEQTSPEKYIRAGLAHLGVIGEPETVYTNWAFPQIKRCLADMSIKNVVDEKHHWAHAAVAYYTSPFKSSAWIVSYDGGGDDLAEGMASFKIFKMVDQKLSVEATISVDLGTPFMVSAYPLAPIIKGPNMLTWSGKLMGLAGHGSFHEYFVDKMRQFYSEHDIFSRYTITLPMLDPAFTLDGLVGREAFDYAYASQHVFTERAIHLMCPVIGQHPDWPVCITGGCALNVLTNQRLRDAGYTIHVPPNPNDAGVALGLVLLNDPPETWPISVTGVQPIERMMGDAVYDQTIDFCGSVQVDIEDIVNHLYEGKILGLFCGDSEAGPRALGHRSIICRADRADLKTRLNAEIKCRESFRPFAPAVLSSDKSEYFEMDANHDSPFMSFSPRVKNPRDLEAIAHVDGTARVQTVDDPSSVFGRVLTKMKEDKKVAPVILNTSLNAKGKPIVASVGDVVANIYNESSIDGIIFEKTNGSLWALIR